MSGRTAASFLTTSTAGQHRRIAGVMQRLVADNVRSVIFADAGHGIAEAAPEEMLAALTEFLAPYRVAAAI